MSQNCIIVENAVKLILFVSNDTFLSSRKKLRQLRPFRASHQIYHHTGLRPAESASGYSLAACLI